MNPEETHSMDVHSPHEESGHADGALPELFEQEEGVEPEGVAASAIMGIVIVGFLLIVATVFLVISWISYSTDVRKSEAAATADAPLLRQTEAEAGALLGQYEVIDAENGIYRIPIEEAMKQVVEDAEAPANVTEAPADSL